MIQNYMGNQLYYGVVEDRNDPEFLGRVRVRVFGIHTKDKSKIPTEDLPWAKLATTPTSHIFMNPPKEGSWVVVFFEDRDLQYPVVQAVVIGMRTEIINSGEGFYDPAENLPDRPKQIASRTVNLDGSGSTYSETPAEPLPQFEGEPDIYRIVRNEETSETVIQFMKDNVVTEVPTAGLNVAEEGELLWTEPTTLYDPIYPYNYAIETESGHVWEIDDTPGAERINIFHRSGTFQEVHPDGSKVDKVVNDRYTITVKDSYNAIYGNVNDYTLGTTNTRKVGDLTEQVNGEVVKSFDLSVIENIGENKNKNIGGYQTEFVESNHGVQAPEITLAGNVHLGADSIGDDGSPSAPKEEPVVLGDKLVTFLESLIDWIDQHAHPTPTGPSGPPVLQKGLSAVNTTPPKAQLKQLLSEIVKTQ